jgi:SPP1 family phage portal protein
MQLQKTDKTVLTPDDILQYISDYEATQVPEFDKLWAYYKGDDKTILERKNTDPNEPDNKIPIPYGRKIITTFTGYAYRPRYITYKPVEPEVEEGEEPKTETASVTYVKQLQDTFNLNNEHIKTSRAGRNTGIFGLSYELLYIDNALDTERKVKAEPRFFSVDPRELILLYDYSSEPRKVGAIRFFMVTKDYYKVEVYYSDRVETYDRKREKESNKWTLSATSRLPNYFGDVPVVPYYFGDEMIGIIKPVLPLIDAYDILISDSLNEYEKFASAYLIMKNFGITDPTKKKEAGMFSQALATLKRKRVFEHLPPDADLKYLTKDIPVEFVRYMSDFIRDQIHVQSHVPDFTGEKMSGASGIAIQRLLFDFENVVSSAEADFDTGLLERIRLITLLYSKAGRPVGTPDMISISHKRNVPLDLKQFADTALTMKNAGFSRYLCADVMPDDIVPDVEEELARQDEDSKALMPDIESIPDEDGEEDDKGGGKAPPFGKDKK